MYQAGKVKQQQLLTVWKELSGFLFIHETAVVRHSSARLDHKSVTAQHLPLHLVHRTSWNEHNDLIWIWLREHKADLRC